MLKQICHGEVLTHLPVGIEYLWPVVVLVNSPSEPEEEKNECYYRESPPRRAPSLD